jgi:hypothetical protein
MRAHTCDGGYRYNPLEEEGVKAVADVVKYKLPLKALKLGWCKIGQRGGAEQVAQLLQFNETLEVRFACDHGVQRLLCARRVHR